MIGKVYGHNHALTAAQDLGLKVATPVGTLVGQLLFGWLADVVGRKRMYGVSCSFLFWASSRPYAVLTLSPLCVPSLRLRSGRAHDYHRRHRRPGPLWRRSRRQHRRCARGVALPDGRRRRWRRECRSLLRWAKSCWSWGCEARQGRCCARRSADSAPDHHRLLQYPLSSIITSEFAATRIRGRMMACVFSAQGASLSLSLSLGSLRVVRSCPPRPSSHRRLRPVPRRARRLHRDHGLQERHHQRLDQL